MDRQQVYPLAIPYETDFLSAQRFTQEGLGLLSADLLGSGPIACGLACTPTSPASLAVSVGAGRLYQTSLLDAAAYGQLTGTNVATINGQQIAGGLGPDTDSFHSVLKQGLLRDPQTIACPAPSTAGTSISYLIEAMFQEVDTTPSVLQFFNTQNPGTSLTGPNGSGLTLPTVRACQCVVQAKTGIAAATGTQTVPATDAGWVPLYVVTVAFGQTVVTAANIAVASGAPFLTQTLPQLIASSATPPGTYAQDTSGTANAIVATLSPALPSYAVGNVLRILPANANTGPVTANINGLGAVSVTRPDGSPCAPDDLRVGRAFDVVIKSGPVMQMLSWPQNGAGDGAKNVISGAAHTYAVSDSGNATWRTNSGTAMTDTLPGATAGALPAGWSGTIVNTDPTGLLSIQVGAGSTLTGSGVVSGYLVLGPGQKALFTGDGVNYQAWGAPGRAKLTANTTLFVATTGSDVTGTGLTAGSAFATKGRAYSWAQQVLDLAGFQLTISVGAGAYTDLFTANGPIVGQTNPVIINGAGMASVTVSVVGTCFVALNGASLLPQNMTLSASGPASACLAAGGSAAYGMSTVFVGPGLSFGSAALAHMVVAQGGEITLNSSYTITAGAQAHWLAQNGGSLNNGNFNITVTLSGTPAFSSFFAIAASGGLINPANAVTFSGAATGGRYSVATGANINTQGSGASYFPGSTVGTGTNYF
ncbi:MAG: hypothetical protein QOJ54_3533 [Aliidongia sp.]|nr:hypothetical protein [Aliidongia sp.]